MNADDLSCDRQIASREEMLFIRGFGRDWVSSNFLKSRLENDSLLTI